MLKLVLMIIIEAHFVQKILKQQRAPHNVFIKLVNIIKEWLGKLILFYVLRKFNNAKQKKKVCAHNII